MGKPYLVFKVRSEAELKGWRRKSSEERVAYGCSMMDLARELNPAGFQKLVERRWKGHNGYS